MDAEAVPAYRAGYRPFAGLQSIVLREVMTLGVLARFNMGREAPLASLQRTCPGRVSILPQAPPLLRRENHQAGSAAHTRPFAATNLWPVPP